VRTAGKSLDALLASTSCLWKGRQPSHVQQAFPTGHTRLDKRLPGGGWPRGAVTELITAHAGLGEFSLLFPALAAAGEEGRWLLLIDPPWIPYPAALHGHGVRLDRLLLIRSPCQGESLWACEQALRSMPESVVLTWPETIRFAALRRLQLAAESQGAMAFLFRPRAAATEASPAALRLQLDSVADGMRVEVLKCRGPRPAEPLLLQHRHCSRREPHEHSSKPPVHLVGDPLAATGPGLSYTRPERSDRPPRRH
jgi:cell division inhibitor SulA/protein ImuA